MTASSAASMSISGRGLGKRHPLCRGPNAVKIKDDAGHRCPWDPQCVPNLPQARFELDDDARRRGPTPHSVSPPAGRRSARTPGKLPAFLSMAAGILLASKDGSPPIRMVGDYIKIVEIGNGGAMQVSFEESRPPPAPMEGCA